MGVRKMAQRDSVRYVTQKEDAGCFVACVAMLLGVRYDTARKLLPVTREGIDLRKVEWSLRNLGFRPVVVSRAKARRASHPTLHIIRWTFCPTTLHAYVFDPVTKRTLDPCKADLSPCPFKHERVYSVNIQNAKKILAKNRRKARAGQNNRAPLGQQPSARPRISRHA